MPSLNDAARVSGTEQVAKARPRIWLVNDQNGELQDAVSAMFTNPEVIVRNTRFHSTIQRESLLLRDFERCLPQLL
eukprot:5221428-Prorocentrum_lima.AAC.1